jgi:C_GCAxxG_C_C family probable redox protein
MSVRRSPKQEKALEVFRAGYNCAQAVLIAFQNEKANETEAAMALAAGFGGGMGRLQQTCGALTGAFMAIGQHCNRTYHSNELIKENSRRLIQSVHKKFVELHKASDCKSLLKVDLNNPDDRKRMKDENLHEKLCEQYVLNAVALLEVEFKMSENL